MKILSEKQMEMLIKNGQKMKDGFKGEIPAVALLRFYHNPPSAWMLASVDPDNHDKAFGLMEVAASGFPELGYVSIKELEGLGDRLDHDPLFKDADKLDIYKYAKMAKQLRQITLRFTEKVTKEDLEGFLD